MAIYATPKPGQALQSKLCELDALRAKLGRGTSDPSQWVKRLRRHVQATAYSSSTAIEGFQTSAEQAAEVIASGGASASDGEGPAALASYLHAMKHVGVMAAEPALEWDRRVFLDLHFDACSFQPDKRPGAYREGWIGVRSPNGQLVFEGPSAEDVPQLMAEVGDRLENENEATHFVVKAAMAHLHLVSVHPFEDGNGRIARIIQSLVLARESSLTPEFGSIEEFIAERVLDYYSVLNEVQGGSYSPERDATPWIEFCVEAHLEQAQRRIDQVAAAAARWSTIEGLIDARNWPDRFGIALEQSLIGGADRASYMREAGIAAPTASGDLRRMLDAGLVEQHGQGPSTRYLASQDLRSRL